MTIFGDTNSNSRNCLICKLGLNSSVRGAISWEASMRRLDGLTVCLTTSLNMSQSHSKTSRILKHSFRRVKIGNSLLRNF